MFKNPFVPSLDGNEISLTPAPYNGNNGIKQRLAGLGFGPNFFEIFDKIFNNLKTNLNILSAIDGMDYFFQPPPVVEPSPYEPHNILLNGLHFVLTQDHFSFQEKREACTELVIDFLDTNYTKVFSVNNLQQLILANTFISQGSDRSKVARACLFLINTIPQNDLVLHAP